MRALGPILALLVVIVLLVSSALYKVDMRENAIVFQLGEVKEVVTKPGLHFKWPLLQNVRHFDMRILTFDDAEPQRFLTKGNRPVLVDSFVKWHISDVRQYYVSVQGDEFRAQTRIKQTVSGVLRDEFGLKRVDLPQDVSESVYRRMEAERKRIANDLRAQGAAEAERIRADADRQREVLLAEAYRDAQRVRGEGDAKSAAIYAAAFNQNPEFFAFYRSMEAYRNTFRGRNDLMVLEPNSDFMRYFRDSMGKGGSGARR
jgi:modulator of FtsH protease HflC